MSERKVYVIQEIPGSQAGSPKINIMGAAAYSTSGKFNFLLPEFSQMIFSPGPLIFQKLYTRRLFIINRRSCNHWCCMFYCI
jgi:hypothetical protein